jgi:hypothetical protein
MKPTQEQVLDWANQVWGTDLGKPWSQTALLHITELATLAYEAGRKDENEACAALADKLIEEEWFDVGNEIRARREQ